MKLTIFGGTSQTGQIVIKQALQEGHSVTAYARNPKKFDLRHDALHIVKGELTDEDAIKRALSEADAVLSLLGPVRRSTTLLITEGTKNVLAAMSQQGIQRFVGVSTPAARAPQDKTDLRFLFISWILRLVARPMLRDVLATAETIRQSDRDWTLVRVPFLKDEGKGGDVKVGYLGQGVKMSLARSALADFLLSEVVKKDYLKQAPIVSGG